MVIFLAVIKKKCEFCDQEMSKGLQKVISNQTNYNTHSKIKNILFFWLGSMSNSHKWSLFHNFIRNFFACVW